MDGRWIVRDAIHEADHNQLYIFSCNNSLYTRDYLGLRTIIYQENSVRGGRVFNAYDLKLEQINPLSKKCELELSMFIQFFFTPYRGKKWTQPEKIRYINEWIGVIKAVWENDAFLASPQNCSQCSGNIKFKLNFNTQIQGYTLSDHWEIVVNKTDDKNNAVTPILGKVNLANDAFSYRKFPKEDKVIYKQRGAVHEFGHMLGLRDEYKGNIDKEILEDYDSVMNSGESPRKRHFSNIQGWINEHCNC